MPRAEKYWIEFEKDQGPVQLPPIEGVEIIGEATAVQVIEAQDIRAVELRERMRMVEEEIAAMKRRMAEFGNPQ
jgi:hypothetical protein